MSRGWASFFASTIVVLILAVSVIAAVIIAGVLVLALLLALPALEKWEYRRILDGRLQPYPGMLNGPGERSLFATMAMDRWDEPGVQQRYDRAVTISRDPR